MEYSSSGKLLRKTYEITKERGWYHAIQKEKVITYLEKGKRKVVRTRD